MWQAGSSSCAQVEESTEVSCSSIEPPVGLDSYVCAGLISGRRRASQKAPCQDAHPHHEVRQRAADRKGDLGCRGAERCLKEA